MAVEKRPRIGFLITQISQYHRWRIEEFAESQPDKEIVGIQLSGLNSAYPWERSIEAGFKVSTIGDPKAGEKEPGAFEVFHYIDRLLSREKFSALFICGYWPAWCVAALFAARLNHVPVILMTDSHRASTARQWWREWVKHLIIPSYSAALVGGIRQKRYLTELGFDEQKIFYGFDTTKNHFFSDAAEALRRKPSPAPSKFSNRYILSLGRLIEKKNIKTLIQAFARLPKPEEAVMKLGLIVVGNGPERAELERLAIQLGLHVAADECSLGAEGRRSVYFAGFQESILEYYAAAELFVLPSLSEEWGLVVNEAMACGLPVAVSDAAGCVETVVIDQENGFVFEPCDENRLADILWTAETQPGRLKTMGASSKRIIEDWGCRRFARGAAEALASAGTESAATS